jgi:hypothetical protein
MSRSLTLESAATHWQVGVPLIGTGSFVSRSVLTAIEAVSNAVRVSDKEGRRRRRRGPYQKMQHFESKAATSTISIDDTVFTARGATTSTRAPSRRFHCQ